MVKKSTRPGSPRSDAQRRTRQADRMACILMVLERIQGRGRYDAAALAAELECSERTVHRYLNVLEVAGVPYWYDRHEKCYRVRPDFNATSSQSTGSPMVNNEPFALRTWPFK